MTDKTNRCMDCQFFRNIRIGPRGSIKGSCTKRTTISWQDLRYGKTPACKKFESGMKFIMRDNAIYAIGKDNNVIMFDKDGVWHGSAGIDGPFTRIYPIIAEELEEQA